MDTSKIVGEKIKSLRESQSIGIEQLAERSGLAVEQIERIEKKHRLAITGSTYQDSTRAGCKTGNLPRRSG